MGRVARLRQHVGDDRDIRARSDAGQGADYWRTVEAGADECAGTRVHGGVSGARQPVTVFHGTLGLVLLERVAELFWSRRNTLRLRRLGGVEADAEGYPYF